MEIMSGGARYGELASLGAKKSDLSANKNKSIIWCLILIENEKQTVANR
jgi:hypothetical protein